MAVPQPSWPQSAALQSAVPSPGGQINRMGACHPVDLPEGYHTAARGQSLARPAAVASRAAHGRPRGRTGVRSTGWHWQAARGPGPAGRATHVPHGPRLAGNHGQSRAGSSPARDVHQLTADPHLQGGVRAAASVPVACPIRARTEAASAGSHGYSATRPRPTPRAGHPGCRSGALQGGGSALRQDRPRRAARSPGRWPRRPVDLPEGYHTVPRGRSWRGRRRSRRGPPTSARAVGLRQVDGTALSRQGAGQHDGNGDGNPGRRARSRLNGPVRLTSAAVVPTAAPLHLESKSALAGQADLRDGRERGIPPTSPRATTRRPGGRAA